MERLATRLTKYLCEQNAINENDHELYQYGFQAGIELLLCFSCSLLLALPMGMLKSVLMFWLIFLGFRSYVGGIHLKKYIWCFLCSCLLSNGISFLNEIFTIPYRMSFLIIITALLYMCGVIILKFRLDECNVAENMYFLKKVVLHSSITILAVFLLYMFSCQKYVSICAYTMLLIISSEIMDKMISMHTNQEY